jgi:hypothetical protein
LRIETEEGERDEGNEEKEGWRWRLTVWGFCAAEGVPLDDEGGCGLCAATCMADRASVSIFAGSPATQASCAICGTER